ncbi:MAG: PEP-CTERM sorting domain-containing protein, partial [Gammaproteobacteria bacterium]
FQPSGDFHAWIEVADSGEAAVPEPTTLALLGLGLAGFGFRARKKKLN